MFPLVWNCSSCDIKIVSANTVEINVRIFIIFNVRVYLFVKPSYSFSEKVTIDLRNCFNSTRKSKVRKSAESEVVTRGLFLVFIVLSMKCRVDMGFPTTCRNTTLLLVKEAGPRPHAVTIARRYIIDSSISSDQYTLLANLNKKNKNVILYRVLSYFNNRLKTSIVILK